MKIVFDYKVFFLQKYGGISRYFIELLREYLKFNEDIKILAPVYINNYLKEGVQKNNRLGIHVNHIPLFTRKILTNYNTVISKLILYTWKPNIVHNTYYSEKLVFDKKCLKVLTVYDLIHEIFHKEYNFEKNNFPKLDSIKNSDIILCPSNKTKKDLIDIYKVNENKIHVIYWGAKEFLEIKENCTNKNIKPFLLYVGDRKRYKNFKNFIKAFCINKKLHNNFNVVCFGGDEFSINEMELFKKINLSKNKLIRITGDDKTLFGLYKNASALVFPSLYEGLGLPPLEAMMQGCPVIASNHEAIVEAVGNAAELFDPNEIDDISKKIENVVFSNEKSQKLSYDGKEQVKKFTWSKCAKETLEVYKKFL